MFLKLQPKPEPVSPWLVMPADRFKQAATFKVDCWTRLDRFLILGTEGGSYYAGQEALTFSNIKAVEECLQVDALRTINRIVEISIQGRAPKNEPALYALAMATSYVPAEHDDGYQPGDDDRGYALLKLPLVARTGTHLLHFVSYVETLRGWGRGLKRAVGNWFLDKEPEDLFYQMMKYRQRDGWSMRDLLRLAHPNAAAHNSKPQADLYNLVFEWATKGWEDVPGIPLGSPEVVTRIAGFEMLQRAKTPGAAAALITHNNFPREAVPTEFLTDPFVWQALLPNLGITALIRNLPTLTRVGVLATVRSGMVQEVVNRLNNQEQLVKGKVHPLTVMVAALTYGSGKSLRGSSSWTPVPAIVDALNDAFYLAFKAAEPTGKRILIALDVSGSMGHGELNGVPGLTPRRAAAAMSLVTVNIEKNVDVVCFSGPSTYNFRESTVIKPFPISSSLRLDQVVELMDDVPFGTTNCALPVLFALENNLQYDAFVVYTDNEHNTGNISLTQALAAYRKKTGIQARLVMQAFASNDISAADPNDPLTMDINGLDSAAPALLADFIRGGLIGG